MSDKKESESMIIDIDIFGSCISRDVFEYDTKPYFAVKEFVSRSSLMSVVSSAPTISKNKIESDCIHEWALKCVRTDITKDVFERLERSPAKIILIDLIDERHKLIQFRSDKSRITNSFYLQKSKILEKIDNEYDLIGIRQISMEEVKNAVSVFAKHIKCVYESENIVINKGFLVNYYKTKQGEKMLFEKKIQDFVALVNNYLSVFYSTLEECIPECHVIEMPTGTIADENNKWGLQPYHYSEDFYTNVLSKLHELCTSLGFCI